MTTTQPLRFNVEWLDEPELAFGSNVTHIDPKVGIPAGGPHSRNRSNHPVVVTAGFVGTAQSIEQARTWLARAAEGVDGDNAHHPFCGYQPDGPFDSRLRLDGPDSKITANDVRDLTAPRLKRIDGFNHLLQLLDDRLRQLASLDAPPTLVFVTLPATITKMYWSVTQRNKGVETVWNLRAGIKARAMQRGLRTQLLRQETIESDLEAHTSDLEHPADLAWNLFTGMYSRPAGFPGRPSAYPKARATLGSRSTGRTASDPRCGRASRRHSPKAAKPSSCAGTGSSGRGNGRTFPLTKQLG